MARPGVGRSTRDRHVDNWTATPALVYRVRVAFRGYAAPCVPPSHGVALCPDTVLPSGRPHISDVAVPDDEPRSTFARGVTPVQRLDVEVRADRTEQVAAALWARGATGVWARPGALVAWFVADSELSLIHI